MYRVLARWLKSCAACCGFAVVIPMTGSGAGAATRAAPPPPVIASTGRNVYDNGTATNLVGTPGRFTFSDPGRSNVVAYLYEFGFADTRIPAGTKGTAYALPDRAGATDLSLVLPGRGVRA